MPTGIYKRTPEMNANNSRSKKGVPKPPRTPEHCTAMSAAKKGVPQTPEHSYAITKGLQESDAVKARWKKMRGVSRSPEICATIARGMEESGAIEAMRGGDDIVWHHTLYDHSDLLKNRVAMTRSKHTMGHHLLRKLGIEILHINVKED